MGKIFNQCNPCPLPGLVRSQQNAMLQQMMQKNPQMAVPNPKS
jgi:hypothetical protein